jgi:hypothetical protein
LIQVFLEDKEKFKFGVVITSRHYYAFTTKSRLSSIFLLCFSARNKEKKNRYKTAGSTRKEEKK